jgi:hypothetical protein
MYNYANLILIRIAIYSFDHVQMRRSLRRSSHLGSSVQEYAERQQASSSVCG